MYGYTADASKLAIFSLFDCMPIKKSPAGGRGKGLGGVTAGGRHPLSAPVPNGEGCDLTHPIEARPFGSAAPGPPLSLRVSRSLSGQAKWGGPSDRASRDSRRAITS